MGLTKDKLETIFWGKPPADPAERKFLRKIDAFVLSYVCLSYFTNYLDRANLANAYVSGMREAVDFKGNEYTYAVSMFTAGYIIGQYPSALVLSSNRISPRFWFPFCGSCWGIITLGLAFVKTPHQVWGLRLIQGFFEASTFCGTHYVLGAWYKDGELGRRSAVFTSSAQLGTLFSGVMQGGIIKNLNGKHGLAGWQWLFIVDFIITVPVAIYGFIVFPGLPHTTQAFWIKPEERELCIRRSPPQEHTTLTIKSLGKNLKAVVTSWQFYTFPILFGVGSCAYEKTGNYSEFLFWLRWTGDYTPSHINYYPCIYTAWGIVGTYLLTMYSDLTANRFIIQPIVYTTTVISCVMLLVWDISTGAKFFAYIVSGCGYAVQVTNFAWATSVTRDNEVVRAVTIFSMNVVGNCWTLWYNIVCWPVVDVPKFRNGQIATLITGAAMIGLAAFMLYLERRFPPKIKDNSETFSTTVFGGKAVTQTVIADEERISPGPGRDESIDEKNVEVGQVHIGTV
ncbi:MFS transporter, ACS family, pantothenate transporter [Kwoniella heveanensis BCC8398]|uniref:MFS transporter, ACS family, pantothenate transporter n=1 Tax=Kwoniella heveanensis BCC8398 TaxID=1296120 RepID=A0A1B9GMQ0_9TREE|nr:MFS transporter, ACS family, pantothenate transporter [Kwoniella heveanensis BCC8398]